MSLLQNTLATEEELDFHDANYKDLCNISNNNPYAEVLKGTLEWLNEELLELEAYTGDYDLDTENEIKHEILELVEQYLFEQLSLIR